MTAKEFLRSVRGIDRRIRESEERAARVRARLESGRRSALSGMPRGGSKDWTETSDALVDFERCVNRLTREMAALKSAALYAIAEIDDPRLREVLELYYIDGRTWDEVAGGMDADRRWVLRLHGRALGKFRVPYPFDH